MNDSDFPNVFVYKLTLRLFWHLRPAKLTQPKFFDRCYSSLLSFYNRFVSRKSALWIFEKFPRIFCVAGSTASRLAKHKFDFVSVLLSISRNCNTVTKRDTGVCMKLRLSFDRTLRTCIRHTWTVLEFLLTVLEVLFTNRWDFSEKAKSPQIRQMTLICMHLTTDVTNCLLINGACLGDLSLGRDYCIWKLFTARVLKIRKSKKKTFNVLFWTMYSIYFHTLCYILTPSLSSNSHNLS